MRIGIDIDDTITNTWECMKPIYVKEFGVTLDELNNSLPYYKSVENKVSSVDEFFSRMTKYYDDVNDDILIKDDVKDVIDILHQKGHKIIFITARGDGYTDALKSTKKYLDSHNIYYDKVIVNALRKDVYAKEEEIDLFIDDSLNHCKEVLDSGIDVLLFETYYNKEDKMFKHVSSWKEILEYIENK